MEDNILDRTLYKQIKNMKRDEMEAFLKRIFENGYKKAVNEQGTSSSEADFVKLREEIGKINGVGAKRLDEIMAVLENELKWIQGQMAEKMWRSSGCGTTNYIWTGKMNLRKLAGLVLTVLGTVLTGIMIMMITGTLNSAAENSKTAIIGGADCPTAIFLISRGGVLLYL